MSQTTTPQATATRHFLKLIFLNGKPNIPTFVMHSPTAALGSSANCSICFKDPKVAPGAALIQDLGSGNFVIRNTGPEGSLILNGKAIRDGSLKAGMEITLGPYRMKVEWLDEQERIKAGNAAQIQVIVEPGAVVGSGPGTAVRTDTKTAWSLGELFFKMAEGGIKKFLFFQILLLGGAALVGTYFLSSPKYQGVRESLGLNEQSTLPSLARNGARELQELLSLLGLSAEAVPAASPSPLPVVSWKKRVAALAPNATPSATPSVASRAGSPAPVAQVTATAAPRPLTSASAAAPAKASIPIPASTARASTPAPTPSPPPGESGRYAKILQGHSDSSPCDDFTGFTLIGDERPDFSGRVLEPFAQEDAVRDVFASLQSGLDLEFYSALSAPEARHNLAKLKSALKADDQVCPEAFLKLTGCLSQLGSRSAEAWVRQFRESFAGTPSVLDPSLKEFFASDSGKRAIQNVERDVMRKIDVIKQLDAWEKGVFIPVRDTAVAWIKEKVPDPAVSGWLTAKLEALRVDRVPCENPDTVLNWTIGGEMIFDRMRNTISRCPSRLLRNDSVVFAIFRTARFMAESIGECHFGDPFVARGATPAASPTTSAAASELKPPSVFPFQAQVSCLKSGGSVWAGFMSRKLVAARLTEPSSRAEACEDTDIENSAFVDWAATEILARVAAARKPQPSATDWQIGFRNVFRVPELVNSETEPVLSLVSRIDGILAAQPTIRKLMGCKSPQHPRYSHCD